MADTATKSAEELVQAYNQAISSSFAVAPMAAEKSPPPGTDESTKQRWKSTTTTAGRAPNPTLPPSSASL